ncbi:Fatty acid desaturase [Acidisarcina polymorpha]|uniref:Fatty acid desaturase n=1 Tax=Acidisarcina polymorpha TaxID=2211140 RepID=A0A2Z5G7L8_9BACT|nr:fatty acid desaturase [Acidisarcina polymorpha]AXC14969.1 Fatty acid desaturase [Acidisarcina polymorpha]
MNSQAVVDPPLSDVAPALTPGISAEDQPLLTTPAIHPLSRAAQDRSVNWFTLFFVALFHAGAIAALFFFSWSAIAASLVFWFLAINLGICVGYHRLLTHRGYRTSRLLARGLAVCGTLALEGSPIYWVVNHRIHHQLTDKHGDPHTPKDGGWWSHAGWVIHGEGLSTQPELIRRYAPDLLKDPFLVLLSKYHYVPLILSAILLYALGGLPWLLWGVFFRVTIGLHAVWFVNSATHIWGSRRFPTKDESRNLWWVALLTGGEGWHNNHHAFPVSARHGFAWYEFDLNYYVIWTLGKAGLAKQINLAQPLREKGR